jgi:hypothetical protein
MIHVLPGHPCFEGLQSTLVTQTPAALIDHAGPERSLGHVIFARSKNLDGRLDGF